VSVSVFPLSLLVNGLVNTFLAAKEVFVEALFSVRSVMYQRKVGDSFFSELLVLFVYVRLAVAVNLLILIIRIPITDALSTDEIIF
jgi:hypothetical protein